MTYYYSLFLTYSLWQELFRPLEGNLKLWVWIKDNRTTLWSRQNMKMGTCSGSSTWFSAFLCWLSSVICPSSAREQRRNSVSLFLLLLLGEFTACFSCWAVTLDYLISKVKHIQIFKTSRTSGQDHRAILRWWRGWEETQCSERVPWGCRFYQHFVWEVLLSTHISVITRHFLHTSYIRCTIVCSSSSTTWLWWHKIECDRTCKITLTH